MKTGFWDSYKARFMNLSIKKKMILANCVIIFIVAFSIGIAAYSLYQQTITNRLATVNLRDLAQIRNSIDYLQKDLKELASFITSDTILQRTVSYTPDELHQNTKDQNYVKYLLNNLLISKQYVSFISISADNGFSHYAASDRSFSIPAHPDVMKTGFYQKAYGLKGTPLWAYVPRENTEYIINNQSDKMTMFKTILKLNDYSTKAFMTISINVSKIQELYKSVLDVEKSTLLFLDENNKIFLFDSNLPQGPNLEDMVLSLPELAYTQAEGTEIYNYAGEDHLLTFVTLNYVNWKLFNIVPLKSYAINLNYVPVIVICVFILALGLGFFFTAFFANLFTKNMKNLLESMNRVKKGNFKETVNVAYHDEVGELCLHYNEMIAYINNLLNQVYALEIEEKIAELKALQAQINPHFLYNTLDTIYWKAMSGDNKGVQEMIHALSKVFRLALNVGRDFSPIAQERKFIGYYVLLQEKRYRNKLQYHLDFSPDILHLEIPKLILQPFVENAIVHGIETEAKETTVSIRGFMDNGRIHFVIRDDGAGMPEHVRVKLMDPQNDDPISPSGGGYGIKNVINRLSIYYEKDYSLTIQSRLGQGTEINLILPPKPHIYLEKGSTKGYA